MFAHPISLSTTVFRTLWGHHQTGLLLLDYSEARNELEAEVSGVAACCLRVQVEASADNRGGCLELQSRVRDIHGSKLTRVGTASWGDSGPDLPLKSCYQPKDLTSTRPHLRLEQEFFAAGRALSCSGAKEKKTSETGLAANDFRDDGVVGAEKSSEVTQKPVVIATGGAGRSLKLGLPFIAPLDSAMFHLTVDDQLSRAEFFQKNDVDFEEPVSALKVIRNISVKHYEDRLRVVDFLGNGRFGAVFHVEETRLKETSSGFMLKVKNYALKIIFEARKSIRNTQISREKRVLDLLRHPSVIKYKGGCADCGYLLLSKAPGVTLEEIVSRGLISKPILKKIAAQLIYILRYFEMNKVAHFDFKPSNIMVDLSSEDCPVTIIDFGKALSGINRFFHHPRGPVAYRPPEMYNYLSDTEESYDAFKTQWYALGVNFYFMAYLTYPYSEVKATGKEIAWIEKHIKCVGDLKITEDDLWQCVYARYDVHPPKEFGKEYDRLFHDLISSLMDQDVDTRAGFEAAKSHPWFEGFDWSSLEAMYADIKPVKTFSAVGAAGAVL